MQSPGTSGVTAAAIVAAKRVVDAGETPQACLSCGREAPLEVIVVQVRASVGMSEEPNAMLMAGICGECRALTSAERRAGVEQLATAAARLDALLGLIRHRAEQLLMPWWGGVGACTAEDIDRASVELRRALERLGVKP